MAQVFAQCKGCGSKGERGVVCSQIDLGIDFAGKYDQCCKCGSLDVDILTVAGVKHEEARKAAGEQEVTS